MKLCQLIVCGASMVSLACGPTKENKQSPQLLNYGRTRCFGGGLAFSADGKTLVHPITTKSDSAASLGIQLAVSRWHNDQWDKPVPFGFPDAISVFPVFDKDESKLYFTSNAEFEGNDSAGLNIWSTEWQDGKWGEPAFVAELNTNANERMLTQDGNGNYYIASDKAGTLDIYVIRKENNQWSTPEPVTQWNSSENEEYITINDDLNLAIIQRTNPGNTTELFVSRLGNGAWSVPVPFNYDYKSTSLPYVQRWPTFSPDGSILYMVSHALIWQYNVAEVLALNNMLAQVPEYSPLKAAPLRVDEPELFGGLQLKTNNGIGITDQGREVYLSRYTQERDSAGNQFIKIFKSSLIENSWSEPQQLAFCKPGVPFEYHPVLSPDGKKIFFNSRAPVPGSRTPYETKNNIWTASIQSDHEWSSPWLVLATATEDYDDYASVAKSGNLYFRSDRPGGLGSGDIYLSRWKNETYQTPENITALNSVDNENDVCIDLDEKFIIFNRYFEATNEIKLFLSIRTDLGWSKPRLIKILDSNVDWELTPTLSPDGAYFYYEVNSNIFRIKTNTLFTQNEIDQMAALTVDR